MVPWRELGGDWKRLQPQERHTLLGGAFLVLMVVATVSAATSALWGEIQAADDEGAIKTGDIRYQSDPPMLWVNVGDADCAGLLGLQVGREIGQSGSIGVVEEVWRPRARGSEVGFRLQNPLNVDSGRQARYVFRLAGCPGWSAEPIVWSFSEPAT